MNFSFVLLALAIMLPFMLFSFAWVFSNKVRQETELQKLMNRVGLVNKKVEGVSQQLARQQKSNWYLWFVNVFKKAGLSSKQQIVKWFVIEAVLIFIAVAAVITRWNTLTELQSLLVVVMPFLPIIWLANKIFQRQKELKQAFPEMLDSVVRSLRSGYSIDGALGVVSEDMKGPLAEELKVVNKQMTVGISMREILREFQSRVDLPEARFFVITLIIQRETGGRLAAILSELADLMRRRESFQAKLKTLTAESRFTAWFIGGAPVLYLAYKYFFDRESMTFFLTDPLGFKLFLFSLLMIGLGTLILRQMLKMRF